MRQPSVEAGKAVLKWVRQGIVSSAVIRPKAALARGALPIAGGDKVSEPCLRTHPACSSPEIPDHTRPPHVPCASALSQELCVFPRRWMVMLGRPSNRAPESSLTPTLHIYRAGPSNIGELSYRRRTPLSPQTRKVSGAVGETSKKLDISCQAVLLATCSATAGPNCNSLRGVAFTSSSFQSDRRAEIESARKGGNISSVETGQWKK